MSFGWSASDIATAISVTYKLIQALDDAHGATDNYREAVAFLRDMLRVLEPLKTFTVLDAYPTYGEEIRRQLNKIKRPVEGFLAAVLKYEPRLGDKARKGWKEKLQSTIRKLDWYIFMETKVLSLRKKIESHMRILDTLMQRLTLDVIYKAQQEFPDTLRSTFQETIQPAFLVAMRECLASYRTHPDANHATVMAKLSEHHQLMEDIKQRLDRPDIIQQQILDGMLGRNGFGGQKAHPGDFESIELSNVTRTQLSQKLPCQQEIVFEEEFEGESLSKICYFILLYFLQFLKGTFFALSQLVEPSRALTSTPLAKYNITFLDAVGSTPRVLPFDIFQSFKMLQTFIEQEFKNLPCSLWVTRGRYLLSSLGDDQTLNENNWNEMVTRGSKIAMSMKISRRLQLRTNPNVERCPERNCSGAWKLRATRSWMTCPVCQKEIFTSVIEYPKAAIDTTPKYRITTHSSATVSQQILEKPRDEDPQLIKSVPEAEAEEKDISSFKRITREIQPIRRFQVQKYRRCIYLGIIKMRIMKDHLLVVHRNSLCERCHAFFFEKSEQVAHEKIENCQPSEAVDIIEGINNSQWVAIETVMGQKHKNRHEKWFELWDLLFPRMQRPAKSDLFYAQGHSLDTNELSKQFRQYVGILSSDGLMPKDFTQKLESYLIDQTMYGREI